MAVFGSAGEHYELGREYLEEAKLFKPETPFKLLLKLGIFLPDENLDLYRYDAPQEFSPEVMEAASQLSSRLDFLSAPVSGHVDLSNLETFTIDGERTRDFDDALSLEKIPQGWRLGVHITDVGSYLQPGDLLDQSRPGKRDFPVSAGAPHSHAPGNPVRKHPQPAGPGIAVGGQFSGRSFRGLGKF